MLYPKNKQPLDINVFKNPPAEYRGVPFWAWNCRVTEDKIDSGADVFEKMGMGGAMVHPRTGMDVEYMGEEYLRLVKYAADRLWEKGMYCWLYDEERFPSGCAGGLVTRKVEYRSRTLVLAKNLPEYICKDKAEFDNRVAKGEKPRGYRLFDYDINFKDGKLEGYEISENGAYKAYVEIMAESGWFNGETYSDVFSPEATDVFLRVTHERYDKILGDKFGKSVPAIFTDEPHMKGKHCLPFYSSDHATLAFNEDMNEAFKQKWGKSILDIAPELIWEQAEGVSVWRYRYHDFVTERFAASYGDRIGAWCEKHNIAYTGHFLSERTLYSQTLALGETMRQYRAQQLPGIDILASQLELTTVKQAESVRRQMGREGLVCELYGVLEWDVSLLEHKLQGDWLAALGVTTRVHHLTFMSMGGEAKRDWPASIGVQSPWWPYYRPLEDYFARVNTLLSRGKAVSRVAVLHPIESFWLRFGTNAQTLDDRERMDNQFESLAQWLLYGLIDYDYISEALIKDLSVAAGKTLRAGEAEYEAIIIPDIITIRQSTLKILMAFAVAGGRIYALGDAPRLVDGAPSDEAKALWKQVIRIDNSSVGVLNALEHTRDIDIRALSNGRRSDNLVYNLRRDGDRRTLFIAHVRDEKTEKRRDYEIKIKGLWRVTRFDAESGETCEMSGRQENGCTFVIWRAYAQDSLLLRLEEGKILQSEAIEKPLAPFIRLGSPNLTVRHEPNALLLDRAMYALDDNEYCKADDILRADNALRALIGLPARDGDQVQPWLTSEEKPEHFARLKYSFHSEKEFTGLLLAMEQCKNARITLNGEAVDNTPVGYYVDEAIQTLRLPPVRRGENIIEVVTPLTRRTNLESMYILGDFGVSARGTRLTLTDEVETLEPDDVTRQGLPFYTGNISYFFDFNLDDNEEGVTLKLNHALTTAVAVKIDGIDAGVIYLQPRQLKLPALKKGAHRLEIIVCGNRFNGFGTLHNSNPDYKWYGPNAYRTCGEEWTDNYLVRPWGLCGAVELMK